MNGKTKPKQKRTPRVKDPLKNAKRSPLSFKNAFDELPGGVDGAILALTLLPGERKSIEVDTMIAAYSDFTPEERERLDFERFVREHKLEPGQFYGLVAEAVYTVKGFEARMLSGIAQPELMKEALRQAMGNPDMMKEFMKAYGHFVVPKHAGIQIQMNQNAQAIAAASATERGLPSFGETLEEADEAQLDRSEPLQLTAASCSIVDPDIEEGQISGLYAEPEEIYAERSGE